MSLVNSPLLQFTPVKDNRWLMLEVCREFQRNKCSRTEADCKFAHPPAHVEVQNGKVICCFDSIKGKCQRKEPPCKYLHPPQHLREQLLQNGRNNLIAKNIQMQVLSHTLVAGGHLLPFTAPFIGGAIQSPAIQAAAPAYPTYLQLLSAADTAMIGAPPPPLPPSHSQAGAQQMTMSNGGGGGGIASVAKMDSRESYISMTATAFATMQQQQQQQDEACAKKRKMAELNDDLQQPQQQQQQILFPMCLPAGANGFSPAGGKRAAVADSKSGIPVYQPGSYQQQQHQLAAAAAAAAAAAFQMPSQQSHAAGAFMPTSWTGDLFQEAACPTLTWV